MFAILRSIKFYFNFQDHPLSKMSVAKLKQGNKALHKEDYDSAIEFYNMVCYCTIRAAELHLRTLFNIVILNKRRGGVEL